MYGASIKQDSCITTMYKKTCYGAYNGGGGLLESSPNNLFSFKMEVY